MCMYPRFPFSLNCNVREGKKNAFFVLLLCRLEVCALDTMRQQREVTLADNEDGARVRRQMVGCLHRPDRGKILLLVSDLPIAHARILQALDKRESKSKNKIKKNKKQKKVTVSYISCVCVCFSRAIPLICMADYVYPKQRPSPASSPPLPPALPWFTKLLIIIVFMGRPTSVKREKARKVYVHHSSFPYISYFCSLCSMCFYALLLKLHIQALCILHWPAPHPPHAML